MTKRRSRDTSGHSTQGDNVPTTSQAQLSPPSGAVKPPDEGNLEEELISGIQSILDDTSCQPSTSSTATNLSENAAALYTELDLFRQRWKREIGTNKPDNDTDQGISAISTLKTETGPIESSAKSKDNAIENVNKDKQTKTARDNQDEIYAKAKRLFLTAVELEQDEMHYESIRYYKQAMHLCPDIEKQIYREQCEAAAKALSKQGGPGQNDPEEQESAIDVYEQIRQSYQQSLANEPYVNCKPAFKPKKGSFHISDLPYEIMIIIFRYVVGRELDLASLESTGLVCKGFYLLSRDQSLWKRICANTWDSETLENGESEQSVDSHKETPVVANFKTSLDWRQVYLERPRVNFDGVYICRTRYIRQGEMGFSDIFYRPFHAVRFYRYLRFFPDGRVLILTTNEEPDKLVPIFRHATGAKHFSPELSILEGTYEFASRNQIQIVAEKNCRENAVQNSRRHAHHYWRQTPLSQKFSLRFEIKTVENRPYKNNVLQWLEYTMLSRLEDAEELTTFDLCLDVFPSMLFSRVRRINLRLTKPLI